MAEATAQIAALEARVAELTAQLDWFRRQLFGPKSERRLLEDNPYQPLLAGFEELAETEASSTPTETITYERRKLKERGEDCVTEQGLRFDETVPVETIEVAVPEASDDAYERIGERLTHRLAQRPGSYVVLRFVRPLLKRKGAGQPKLVCPPAPRGLWEGSIADVSVVAGVLVDKFCHHLPLYRQHQRLTMNGIRINRATLTTWTHRAARLLAPIHEAQLRHILQSKTLAIDETPIKAGRAKAKGKMRTGWYWPVYGEAGEIAFTFSPRRARAHLEELLAGFTGTLLSDGAGAYASFAAQRPELTHAQCWAHTRRKFVRAEDSDPKAVAEALALIGHLYKVEEQIRQRGLDAERTLAYRAEHALPAVDAFFAWCAEQCQRMELVPSHPLAKAIAYAREREGALRVYLGDPSVAIDTNHLERALRPIPMGRKAWLFCWTEVGAEHVGTVQSLVATCRIQGINPYTYLVDVLQRVAIHPASRVEELTPRRWKELFAHDPLRSDLDRATR